MADRLNILVVGGGGREHALSWKLAQSPRAARVFCAPGNAGIAQHAECVPISPSDLEALADFAQQHEIGLTVVGPEAPLAEGIVDLFRARGLQIFGPSRAAARIESSKVWCKRLLAKCGVPTGDFAVFDDPDEAISYLDDREPPIVVKADGLAAGKGVTVARTREEARQAVQAAMVDRAFGEAGSRVVIEEFLAGREVSVMAICDGENLYPLPFSQDHKQVYDDDRGPNTGGMGAFSPVPFITPDLAEQALETIMRPTLRAMAEEGAPYVGCLYGGLMLTEEGLKALEFNCRFGDPESQAVLPRLEADLVDLLEAAVSGRLPAEPPQEGRAAVCVVMASGGYPGKYETGRPIRGLDAAARMSDVVVFHAGTRRTEQGIVTAGGRVLGVTGLGDDLPAAIAAAYRGVEAISFDGAHYRRDIGRRKGG